MRTKVIRIMRIRAQRMLTTAARKRLITSIISIMSHEKGHLKDIE